MHFFYQTDYAKKAIHKYIFFSKTDEKYASIISGWMSFIDSVSCKDKSLDALVKKLERWRC